MQRLFLIIVACLALLTSGCGGDSSEPTTADSGGTSKEAAAPEEPQVEENAAGEYVAETSSNMPEVTIPKGPPPKQLVIEDLKQGSGVTAKAGDKVSVYYVGVTYSTKVQFDGNFGSEPFTFNLGAAEVIKGWDKGVAGMKVGGRRKLTIPPDLAYGESGSYPIPPNATLVFVVELLKVK